MVGGWVDDLLSGRSPVKWERVVLWVQVVLIGLLPLVLIGMMMYFRTADAVVLALTGAGFLGLACYAGAAPRVGNLRRSAACMGVQMVLTFTLVVWLVFPVISPFKHHTAFFESIAARVMPGDYVVIYGEMHEANLGQACISLNRILPVIRDPELAVRLLEPGGRRVFVISEKEFAGTLEWLVDSNVRTLHEEDRLNPLAREVREGLKCWTNER
jgi:hypothetical protein